MLWREKGPLRRTRLTLGSNCGSVGSEVGTDLARTRHIRAGSVRTPWVGGGSGWDQEAVRRVAAA